MTEYIASSALVGRRPRMLRMRSYSSGLSPSAPYGWSFSGVVAATSTVSSCGVLGAAMISASAAPGASGCGYWLAGVDEVSMVTGGELQKVAASGCRGADA